MRWLPRPKRAARPYLELRARIEAAPVADSTRVTLAACAWAGATALASLEADDALRMLPDGAALRAATRDPEVLRVTTWIMLTQAYTAGTPDWQRELRNARLALPATEAEFERANALGDLFVAPVANDAAAAKQMRRISAFTLDWVTEAGTGRGFQSDPATDTYAGSETVTTEQDRMLSRWGHVLATAAQQRNARLQPIEGTPRD